MNSPVPSTLPAGTRWPISGGALSATSSGQFGEENLYVTGHENGLVKIWDASSQLYSLLSTVESQVSFCFASYRRLAVSAVVLIFVLYMSI